MKVGIVIDQYFSTDGGAHTFQGEILAALSEIRKESSHEFEIFSRSNSSDAIDGLSWTKIPRPGLVERAVFLISRFLPRLRDSFKVQSSLEKIAKQAGAEFLWFLSPRIQSADIPYMTIVLDLQHRLQPWFPEVSARGEWRQRERHYARLLPRATAVIVGTQAGKNEVQRFYGVPSERIHLLPHLTPRIAPNPDSSADLGKLGLEPGYLFYPAQFWSHKNHLNLLKALAILRDQGSKFQMVFTGADFGSLKKVQAHVRKLDLDQQVKILGFVNRQELASLYQNALALTYLSYFGPENLPPLEAFACGCPVIAAEVDGAREQLGEAALLVDPSDPPAIAAAILKLVQDETLRKQVIERGRVRAAQWNAKDFVRGAFKVIDQAVVA